MSESYAWHPQPATYRGTGVEVRTSRVYVIDGPHRGQTFAYPGGVQLCVMGCGIIARYEYIGQRDDEGNLLARFIGSTTQP